MDKVYIIGSANHVGLASAIAQVQSQGVQAEIITMEQVKELGVNKAFEREPLKFTAPNIAPIVSQGIYSSGDFNNRSGRRKRKRGA